jgi:hypothetical protein
MNHEDFPRPVSIFSGRHAFLPTFPTDVPSRSFDARRSAVVHSDLIMIVNRFYITFCVP